MKSQDKRVKSKFPKRKNHISQNKSFLNANLIFLKIDL